MLLRVQEHVKAGVWECLEGVEVAIGIRSDNTVTVAALNSCYSKSPILLAVVARIWVLAARLGFSLKASWLPGRLNPLADYLSRIEVGDTWGLSEEWFGVCEERWGSFTVDVMGAWNNCKVARYFSRFWDPHTSGHCDFPPSGYYQVLIRILIRSV